MSEREGFLRAICADPDDDTVRLAFADWLQEQGESNHAEFIRLHIEWCRRDPQAPPDDDLWLRMSVAWEASGLSRSALQSKRIDAYDRGFVAGVQLYHAGFAAVESAISSAPVRVAHLDPATEEEATELSCSPALAKLRGLCFTEPSETAGLLLASPHLADLDFLHFGGENSYESIRFARLLASAPHLERLRVLDLEGSHLGDEGLAVLARADHLRSVRKLALSSGGRFSHFVGEVGLRALADSMAFTGLTHLSLRDCEIFDEGLRQLLRWPGTDGLIELDLAFTLGVCDGMTELARCPRFKNLRRLSLCASSLSDEALAGLASATWLPHLQQLWIAAWEDYGDNMAEQTEEALKAFSVRLGPRMILRLVREVGFELSTVGETDRIWHRLRHSQRQDETGLNLACIL